jgi:hypothetical protein
MQTVIRCQRCRQRLRLRSRQRHCSLSTSPPSSNWRDVQNVNHVQGKYIIADRPMSEEEWAKERATVIDAKPVTGSHMLARSGQVPDKYLKSLYCASVAKAVDALPALLAGWTHPPRGNVARNKAMCLLHQTSLTPLGWSPPTPPEVPPFSRTSGHGHGGASRIFPSGTSRSTCSRRWGRRTCRRGSQNSSASP